MEKAESWYTKPFPPLGYESPRKPIGKWRRLLFAGFIASTFTIGLHTALSVWKGGSNAQSNCPQTTALVPEINAEMAGKLSALYGTQDFRQSAIAWLSGAVQVPTESFDKMGPVGEDPRWEVFKPFHAYLEKAFPKVHQTLNLTKVNTYGLLYHWQGSDEVLKPILLAGHQDVVPVEPITVSQWTQPPYSGHFDGKWIWGRGSNDDKSGTIGTLASIESLIDNGFQPKRSVVLAFGFDEEASGGQGAGSLSVELLRRYGKDSMAFIIDEGGGFSEQYGTIFATPAIAEKGYVDTKLEVKTPGGHSSVPPPHTSIGILSTLLVALEAHPIKPVLNRATTPYATLQCLGAHAPDLPRAFRHLIQLSLKSNWALRRLENIVFQNPVMKAQIGTTQAIDLIKGGVKTNALPESAEAVVNHRVATDSHVGVVQQRDLDIVVPFARQFNLSVKAFGRTIQTRCNSIPESTPYYGSLELSDAWGTALEPAPVTPTNFVNENEAEPYKLLSGTIIATYEASVADKDENKKSIIVSPGISTGNTDTRYYWDLTRHIFRYNHKDASGIYNGAHTINEAITADSFVEMIKFFTNLILNADESTKI